MAVTPSRQDLLIAYRHYVRTVTNINLEDQGQTPIDSVEMEHDFNEGLDNIIVNATREHLEDEYEKVYSRQHLDQLPRHTCVQGYDGFMHVVVDEGVFTLATGSSHNAPHDSCAIELPATIRYRPNQEHLKRENS